MRNHDFIIWNTKHKIEHIPLQVRYLYCFDVIANQTDFITMITEKPMYHYIICSDDYDTIKPLLQQYQNVEMALLCNHTDEIMNISQILDEYEKDWYLIVYPLAKQVTLPNAKHLKKVYCAGSSKEAIRCDFAWVKDLAQQCRKLQYSFSFVQTGCLFCKDGKDYKIPKALQKGQAQKANVDYEYQPHQALFERLDRSTFRSSFHLRKKELAYLQEKGLAQIEVHAHDLIAKRLCPAVIENDGRQTPMKGHPVFLAQHASGTCCRGCLYQWHHIEPGRQLSKEEEDYIVSVIMDWIIKDAKL